MDTITDLFGPVIHSYSRADALADGYLVDVSETAKEAGIKFPVALTRTVWDRYCEFEPAKAGEDDMMQDVAGRLWDVLWMLRVRLRASQGDTINYQLHVALPNRGDWQSNEAPPERGSGLSKRTHRLVTLKAICGPGDDAAPVITIMLPGED